MGRSPDTAPEGRRRTPFLQHASRLRPCLTEPPFDGGNSPLLAMFCFVVDGHPGRAFEAPLRAFGMEAASACRVESAFTQPTLAGPELGTPLSDGSHVRHDRSRSPNLLVQEVRGVHPHQRDDGASAPPGPALERRSTGGEGRRAGDRVARCRRAAAGAGPERTRPSPPAHRAVRGAQHRSSRPSPHQ